MDVSKPCERRVSHAWMGQLSRRRVAIVATLLSLACESGESPKGVVERKTPTRPAAQQAVANANGPARECRELKGALAGHWLCSGAKSWGEARKSCRALSADLATLDDPAEYRSLSNENIASAFVGLTDRDHAGVWIWAGEASTGWCSNSRTVPARTLARWDGAPRAGEGHCAALVAASGRLQPVSCDASRAYLCEPSRLPKDGRFRAETESIRWFPVSAGAGVAAFTIRSDVDVRPEDVFDRYGS